MKWELAALVCAVMLLNLSAVEQAKPNDPPYRAFVAVGFLFAMLTFVVVGLISD